VRELLTNFGPVCLIWFDTPRMMTTERSQRFIDLIRNLQPACLIDGRLGAAGDYRSMADNSMKNGDALTVTLPEKAPGEYASVLCWVTRAAGT